MGDGAAYARWEKISDWPLLGLALVFAVAYAWQVLGDLIGPAQHATQSLMNITWATFAFDYLVRLTLTKQRGRWFVRHIPSLLVVVLPLLRPVRLIGLLTVVNVFHRAAGGALRGKVVLYTACSTVLLIVLAALAVFDAERFAPDASITSFGDALWWACVTITTVGYGDVSPVTVEGRFIAVGLMVSGVALLGSVTATFAAWLVERVAEQDEAKRAATQAELKELTAQVAQLRALLIDGAQRGQSSPDFPNHRAAPSASGAAAKSPTSLSERSV